jgi:uncharacterized membrane protein YfcA
MTLLLVNAVLATGLLCVALYAQYRIPFHTAGRTKVAVTRGVLAAVGALLGYVAASQAAERPLAMLLFVQGFGIAHIPSAFILFFKRARHEGRS